MALFTPVLLVTVLLPFIRCDKHKHGGKHQYHDYHPEYAFARCDFAQFGLPDVTATLAGKGNATDSPGIAPFSRLLPESIQGIGELAGADGGYGYNLPPISFISVQLRQRIGKKYGDSFPLEIAVHAMLGKIKYPPDNNIGLHVREYGVDSYFERCEAAGEDYNPLKTTHGNIWDHPKKRHVGDWGNVRLTAGSYVNARFNDYLASIVPGDAGDLSILGKSIVLFTREDDLGKKKSDQSTTDGSVGPPILCCAVKMSDGSDFPHDDGPDEPNIP